MMQASITTALRQTAREYSKPICEEISDEIFVSRSLISPKKISSHVNGNVDDEDEEEEETEEVPEVEKVPAKPLKTETNMNARRWKWEVLDD